MQIDRSSKMTRMQKSITAYFWLRLLALGFIIHGCKAESSRQNTEKTPEIKSIKSGQEWYDTDGKLIQSHGGGMLYHEGIYYWYGENKDTATKFPRLRTDIIGINCYSSTDFYNWKNEGIVLPAVKGDSGSALYPQNVLERPKVIFNDKTGKFIMWFHVDDSLYQKAHVGIAVSDSPKGPFIFKESFRPLGFESRDMTVFKDDDSKAYLVFGSGWHNKIVIAELSEDYLSLNGPYTAHLHTDGPPLGREAPALFKRKGKYYLITSGTTGWFTNPAQCDVAENINGPYKTIGNPCEGMYAEVTFFGQSTHVQKIQGKEDAFVFMADRWIPTDLKNSRYLWLPVQFNKNNEPVLKWIDEWDMDFYK